MIYFENIELTESNLADIEDFYVNKTLSRINRFNDVNGKFYDLQFCINGMNSDSMKNTISNFDFSLFLKINLLKIFMVILIDNIILSENFSTSLIEDYLALQLLMEIYITI